MRAGELAVEVALGPAAAVGLEGRGGEGLEVFFCFFFLREGTQRQKRCEFSLLRSLPSLSLSKKPTEEGEKRQKLTSRALLKVRLRLAGWTTPRTSAATRAWRLSPSLLLEGGAPGGAQECLRCCSARPSSSLPPPPPPPPAPRTTGGGVALAETSLGLRRRCRGRGSESLEFDFDDWQRIIIIVRGDDSATATAVLPLSEARSMESLLSMFVGTRKAAREGAERRAR